MDVEQLVRAELGMVRDADLLAYIASMLQACLIASYRGGIAYDACIQGEEEASALTDDVARQA